MRLVGYLKRNLYDARQHECEAYQTLGRSAEQNHISAVCFWRQTSTVLDFKNSEFKSWLTADGNKKSVKIVVSILSRIL